MRLSAGAESHFVESQWGRFLGVWVLIAFEPVRCQLAFCCKLQAFSCKNTLIVLESGLQRPVSSHMFLAQSRATTDPTRLSGGRNSFFFSKLSYPETRFRMFNIFPPDFADFRCEMNHRLPSSRLLLDDIKLNPGESGSNIVVAHILSWVKGR